MSTKNDQEYQAWDNYFQRRYHLELSQTDIDTYQNWFYPQWRKINRVATPLTDQQRILEIGSSYGGFYAFLNSAQQQNYTGLEMDQSIVDFANQHFQTKAFKHSSIADFTASQKFDRIYAFEVLEHLLEPVASIDKIFALLKKGGQFIGTTPHPGKGNVLGDDSHYFVLHPLNWRRLFLRAGFKIVETFPLTFPIPYLWRINKHLNPILPINLPLPHIVSTNLIIATKE